MGSPLSSQCSTSSGYFSGYPGRPQEELDTLGLLFGLIYGVAVVTGFKSGSDNHGIDGETAGYHRSTAVTPPNFFSYFSFSATPLLRSPPSLLIYLARGICSSFYWRGDGCCIL
ncbi:hypothetical protein CDAR_383191 [Caerostris darwini]|uniref:Uncharacterized protein n=1 Tax=Caerostris darwini TaxID=1538125 RepID=A0AAV4P0R4_9ARAC|nr:hypothetical protein CDAR_383191 [Caerostris darwini]